MSKLNLNEVDELLYNENKVHDEYIRVPKDAYSKFRYDIKETLDELEDNMKAGAAEPEIGKRDWKLVERDGKKLLVDPDFNSYATVVRKGDKMEIGTALSQNLYSITEDDKGTHVEFTGPLNALGVQNLLPEMTYVSGTLQGKFVEAGEYDTSVYANRAGKDITPYVDMDVYCDMRKEKNNGEENPQDRYGYKVNHQFDNDIPGLPKAYKTVQQEKAEEMVAKKDRIKENVEHYRNGEKSGVVKADVLAQAMINKRGR